MWDPNTTPTVLSKVCLFHPSVACVLRKKIKVWPAVYTEIEAFPPKLLFLLIFVSGRHRVPQVLPRVE